MRTNSFITKVPRPRANESMWFAVGSANMSKIRKVIKILSHWICCFFNLSQPSVGAKNPSPMSEKRIASCIRNSGEALSETAKTYKKTK